MKNLEQCLSCFHVNRCGETTTAAHTGIARTNVLVYSCLKLFLLLALSLPSLENHQGFRASLRSFIQSLVASLALNRRRPRCMRTTRRENKSLSRTPPSFAFLSFREACYSSSGRELHAGETRGDLVFQAESASPDVQVVAVIDPVVPLSYMFYCSGTTVSTSGSTTPTWCLSR